MLISLWVLLGLLLALHAYREYWRRRDLPQIYTGEFEGELIKAGTTYIARRPARNDSQRTIVCFPGFLHDMRYFQEVYREHDAFYLGLAVERLVNSREVRLHGHSRGGAVVLETGRQYPELVTPWAT